MGGAGRMIKMADAVSLIRDTQASAILFLHFFCDCFDKVFAV